MRKILIEMSLDDYVEMLEQRREEIKERDGLECPDAVWEYFIEICVSQDVIKSSARDLVDNLIINGEYMEIENHSELMEEIYMLVPEISDKEGYIKDNIVKLLDNTTVVQKAIFTYLDPQSKYGRGICFHM